MQAASSRRWPTATRPSRSGRIKPSFRWSSPRSRAFLYSSRVPWYPQATSTDYATATLKISVPPAYDCVASGVLEDGWPRVMGTKEEQSERRIYSFKSIAAASLSRLHRHQTRPRADGRPRARAGQDDDAGRRGEPAAGAPRTRSGAARGRHREILCVADRRLSVSDVHARSGGERSAWRPQPGVLRGAVSAAADVGAVVAQRPGVVRSLPGLLPRARSGASVVRAGGRMGQLPRAVAERGVRAVLRRAVRAAQPRRRRVWRRAAADAPMGDRPVGSGSRVSRLPSGPHQGRRTHLPGAGLQQGRRRAAHAASPAGRRGIFRAASAASMRPRNFARWARTT